MTKWESSCVDCPSMGLPCQGSSCRNHDDYPVYSCDKCGSEGTIYDYEDHQLCLNCLEDFAWETSQPTDKKKCEGCGCDDEEVRDYGDGRIGCKQCIGDWAWDESEMVGDFIP